MDTNAQRCSNISHWQLSGSRKSQQETLDSHRCLNNNTETQTYCADLRTEIVCAIAMGMLNDVGHRNQVYLLRAAIVQFGLNVLFVVEVVRADNADSRHHQQPVTVESNS